MNWNIQKRTWLGVGVLVVLASITSIDAIRVGIQLQRHVANVEELDDDQDAADQVVANLLELRMESLRYQLAPSEPQLRTCTASLERLHTSIGALRERLQNPARAEAVVELVSGRSGKPAP